MTASLLMQALRQKENLLGSIHYDTRHMELFLDSIYSCIRWRF